MEASLKTIRKQQHSYDTDNQRTAHAFALVRQILSSFSDAKLLPKGMKINPDFIGFFFVFIVDS